MLARQKPLAYLLGKLSKRTTVWLLFNGHTMPESSSRSRLIANSTCLVFDVEEVL